MIKRYWQRFLKYAKLYLLLPEMRLFWIFLAVIVIVLILNVALLPAAWAAIIFGFFAVTGVMIFINGLRLAKSNLEVKVERSQLTSIVNNLKDGVVAYDLNFKIVIFNKAAEEIFEVDAKELIGQYIDPSYAQKQRYRLMAQAMFPSLAPVVVRISQPDVWPQIVDVSFERGDLDLRISTSRIFDVSGSLLGFFKVIIDRTREKEMIRAKSEFITIAAHQLRTPLTGIHWALETLAGSEKLPSEHAPIVKDGLVASERLLRVVNDLLDVAKIEEGKFGYQFQDFNLIDFVNETISSAAVLAKEYGVNVYFEKPSEPQIAVRADPNKLRIALSNLVDNAIKYNVANGEVFVKVERLKNQPYIQVSIKDTGIGIPPEEMRRLFTRFYRGSNVMREETTGSGLGLYIVRNVIRRHGGDIKAESQAGRGTTFYFTLPTDPKLIPIKEIVYGEE